MRLQEGVGMKFSCWENLTSRNLKSRKVICFLGGVLFGPTRNELKKWGDL